MHATALKPALGQPPQALLTPLPRLDDRVRALLARGRFAVVHAGDKREEGAVIHPTVARRPWKSYRAVAEDIAGALHRLGALSVAVLPEDMNLPQRLKDGAIDFVWLNTAGVQGIASAGHAAAMLEMLGLPYVGHDPMTAALLDNKHAFKQMLKAAGVATAPSYTWRPSSGPFLPGSDRLFRATFAGWRDGFVVKPVNGRASLHVSHVANERDLIPTLLAVYEATGNAVLIEGFLPGREFCAAACGPTIRRDGVLGTLGEPFVFAMVERCLDPGEAIFTSMDERPITADRVRPLSGARDFSVMAEIEALARQVCDVLAIETLVRIDIRADASGRLHVLEANPKPDLKAPADGVTSLIVEGLAGSGLGYDDLIYSLLADSVAQRDWGA